ncbi:MAG: sugar transferase [Verrucomicrobiota bacterium]|nr:sugar transferase [Verrucomicrobiota bacterium]
MFSAEPKARSRDASAQVLLLGLLGDTAVVFLALALSSWLRFETGLVHLGVKAAGIHWADYSTNLIFGTLLFILLLPHRQLYDLHRILNLRQTVPVIIKAAMSWFVAYLTLSWLLRYDTEISRIYAVIAFIVTTTLFISWRLLLYKIIRCKSIAQRLRQRILFVGWSAPAMSIAQAVMANDNGQYEIAGYVPYGAKSWARQRHPGVRRLGDNASDTLQKHDIDMVILADLNASTEETVALANLCEKEMIEFKVIPSCFQIFLSCLHFQTVSGVPVLGVSYFPLEQPFNIIVKQLTDLAGGLVGLLLSAPLIALFGLLVYMEDPGPIIYRQRRIGRYGRLFWIYKIRSMKTDAERDGRVGWTVKNDPRRLRVGAFMRRWNIDELPQFWNVLKGEMSLVGPRPERPELIQVFKEEVPHYNARHGIKPGITGWAQVNGLRGDTDLNERVRYDLYYIENWSLLLDIQIIFLTFLRHKNAA